MEQTNSQAVPSDAEMLIEFERAIRMLPKQEDLKSARLALRRFLWSQAGGELQGSVVEAIEKIAREKRHRPIAAAVLLRSLAVDQLIPSGGAGAQLDRSLVSIVEDGLPKICEFFGLNSRSQTFEKLSKLRDAHKLICEILVPLLAEFQTLEGLMSSRQIIIGALNHSSVRSYGEAFRLGPIRGVVDRVMYAASQVVLERPTLLLDVEELERTIADGTQSADDNGSFVFYDFLVPFLHHADRALKRFIASARGRFSAKIVSTLADDEYLPKRYPLHETGREIHVRAPLRNLGPGLAMNVTAKVTVHSECVVVQERTIVLGDVLPGDFSFSFDALVIIPLSSVSYDVETDWGEIGTVDRHRDIFAFNISAQEATIEWSELEYWHPYSTAPAEGDRFIGRAENVKGLASRLLRSPMEPFYITGQKRIGKTSLAYASVAFAQAQARQYNLHSTYVLWGQIAHVDPKASLAELGRLVEELITSNLPSHVSRPTYSFDGTLAPLMRLSDLASKSTPQERFVVIIDEFDEIHPELYLHGNLAESFFANIRALATTKNVCIILVGGENMPFIMERQGEKLNKFTRQNLSYFSRASEWEDFAQLVRFPTSKIIIWHDDAVSAVFNETSGNPYFANLLCSRVLREAVRLRDADITADEVSAALEAEVSSLDANSFAHLWHDGIFKPVAEREPEILRRRRVLVALGRCLRKRLALTISNLSDLKGSALSNGEIEPTLNEFNRRGVLSEVEGTFSFCLPIFERWLLQDGLAKVQPDPVSEELAAAVQAEEDASFVRSEEVAALAGKWPTYQGKHVGSEEISAWYNQAEGFRAQRLLFKLLQGVRFVGEPELREKASSAYVQLRKQMREFVRHSLADRRNDVIVTYLDGHGKSGEYFASLFVEENNISVNHICSQNEVSARIAAAASTERPISAVIVIDDLAATGRTLADSVVKFAERAGDDLLRGGVKLLICALYATRAATQLILERLRTLHEIECDFRAGEILSPKSFAFSEESPIWANLEERERAKALVGDLGARVYRNQPLGFGGMGLLMIFPTTVPNNTLPILHSRSKPSAKSWRPLFLRPVN